MSKIYKELIQLNKEKQSSEKIGRGPEQTLLSGRHTNGQQIYTISSLVLPRNQVWQNSRLLLGSGWFPGAVWRGSGAPGDQWGGGQDRTVMSATARAMPPSLYWAHVGGSRWHLVKTSASSSPSHVPGTSGLLSAKGWAPAVFPWCWEHIMSTLHLSHTT